MSPRAPHRFYYSGQVRGEAGEVVELSRQESRHLLRVLRLRMGARVDVFDAQGRAFAAELNADAQGVAQLRILEAVAPAQENPEVESKGAGSPGPSLNLAVAVIKRRGMELMIEKLSELGVDALQPLITRRTVVGGGVEEKADPPERWERLALAAAKQCGRNKPLQILPAVNAQAWLQRMQAVDAEATNRRVAYADFAEGAVSLGAWLREETEAEAKTRQQLWIVIGPEGGWTPEEGAGFRAVGCRPVTLGTLTLRAETAAIAAAAAVRLL